MRYALGKGMKLNAKNTIIVQYGGKKKEYRIQNTEYRIQNTEVRSQKSEDRLYALCPMP
jgi:hypothetical protein